MNLRHAFPQIEPVHNGLPQLQNNSIQQYEFGKSMLMGTFSGSTLGGSCHTRRRSLVSIQMSSRGTATSKMEATRDYRRGKSVLWWIKQSHPLVEPSGIPWVETSYRYKVRTSRIILSKAALTSPLPCAEIPRRRNELFQFVLNEIARIQFKLRKEHLSVSRLTIWRASKFDIRSTPDSLFGVY
jgi:hypothetical protein